MSTRSNQRFQYAFTIALSLHGLAALGMTAYFRSQASSENVVVNIMNMNWEVEASGAKSVVKPTAVKKTSFKKVAVNKSLTTDEPAGQSSPASTANPAVMENYLSSIRDRLGKAIHLHQPRGTVNSQMILKVAIHSSGAVTQIEIEKTSEHPEVDHAVLAAFESLLPLPPFPDEWKKTEGAPEMVTVRIPVTIRSRN